MTILGIVAEYDPFHNGHLYHLTEAKRRVRPDYTFVVLSPCFKQRGTLALLSPTDRARLALEAGADAVFALPVLWTVRDAEHYALGAVSMLTGLGATHLAFGVETDSPDLLQQTAGLLESPPQVLEAVMKERLSHGAGWPAALSAAVRSVLPEAGGLLDHPNNVLAVSYLRALLRLRSSAIPVPIPRSGGYHDRFIHTDSPSASALRGALRRGDYAGAFAAMPDFSAGLIRRRFLERRIPDPSILDAVLIHRLRSMPVSVCAALPDLSEGLENALRRAAGKASGREELISILTGPRYPSARISRLCAHVLLESRQEDLARLPLPDSALVLGLRRHPGMTAFWKGLSLKVVSSFTEWQKTAHPADLLAWRLWGLSCRLPGTLPFTEKIVTDVPAGNPRPDLPV